MTFFLSIVIPCYNVEQYLPATLQSLRNLQDAEDCEFIFVNDGSTDNTPSLIQDFVAHDSRAIYLSQTNQGVSSARNAAIDVAKGQYVICLDGDDTLVVDAITIIRQSMQGADVLLSPIATVYNDRTILCPLTIPQGKYTITQLFQSCNLFPTAPKLVYRTDIIKSNALRFNPVIKCGEVYDFTISFFEHAQNIHVVHTPFYNYIMRNSSATHSPNFESDISVIHLLDHFNNIQCDWAKKNAFQTTAFRLICSFTYNKYIKLYLLDKNTLETLTTLFNSPQFQKLLQQLLRYRKLMLRDRLMVKYMTTLPAIKGYILLTKLYHFIKLLRPSAYC